MGGSVDRTNLVAEVAEVEEEVAVALFGEVVFVVALFATFDFFDTGKEALMPPRAVILRFGMEFCVRVLV